MDTKKIVFTWKIDSRDDDIRIWIPRMWTRLAKPREVKVTIEVIRA